MATTSLRDYHNLIGSLVDQNKNDEAIFHCTKILETYPKCIETYKNLGKALLESNKTDDAYEVFSKILSVFPDDALSHAGLSAVLEEKDQLTESIWHMEQAFDAQPSNFAIQEELKRLYTRRDGIQPSKIRLTRGALIRMYAKGDLYQQAISEANAALQANPERIDLKVLLAKTHFSMGSHVEAAELCEEILETHPYCHECLQIMDKLFNDPEIENRETTYREKLIELDPYYSFIDDYTSVQDVPAEKVIIEVAEYVPASHETEPSPDWASQLGITYSEDLHYHPDESKPVSQSSSEQNPTETSPEPFNEVDLSEDEIGENNTQTEDDLPEWIAKAGWIRAVDSIPSPDQQQNSEEEGNSATPAEELPDWLKSFNPEISVVNETTPTPSDASLDEIGPDIANIADLTTEQLQSIISGEDEISIHTLSAEIESRDQEVPLDEIIPVGSNTENLPDNILITDETTLPDWLKDFDLPVEASVTDTEELTPGWVSEEKLLDDTVHEDLDKIISRIPSEIADEEDIYQSRLDAQTIIDSDETYSQSTESLDERLEMNSEMTPPPIPLEYNEIEDRVISTESLDDTQTTIPSWVSSILASINPEKAVAQEPVGTTDTVPEEIIPLITDLPEEIPHDGVLSDDESIELMDWLKDTDLEIQEKSVPSSTTEENLESGLELLPEISLEELSEPSAQENEIIDMSATEPLADDQLEIDADNIDRRISGLEAITESTEKIGMVPKNPEIEASVESLLNPEVLAEKEISLSETETEIAAEPIQVEISSIPDPVELLEKNDFVKLENLIKHETLPEEMSTRLVDAMKTRLNTEPDSFILWRNLGDIQLKNSKLDEALEAYFKAESILINK